jgi:hypothetical protein
MCGRGLHRGACERVALGPTQGHERAAHGPAQGCYEDDAVRVGSGDGGWARFCGIVVWHDA